MQTHYGAAIRWIDPSYTAIYHVLTNPVCRRNIEMTPGTQSRDDTPVGGGHHKRGRHNQTPARRELHPCNEVEQRI
jgi:hypothetical protein